MRTDWKTFGHANIKDILEKQLEVQKFPHAYLFLGPEGIGKRQVAQEFAARILNTGSVKSHPDFSLLDEEEEISVERIRNFIATLGYKPFQGVHKVAVINNANLLNIQSSNALLKTLEEPSPSSILILVSSKSLLPTIMSRCQNLTFNGFTKSQMEAYAREYSLGADSGLLSLSSGSPGMLQRFQDNPDKAKVLGERVKELGRLTKSSVSSKLLAVAKYSDLENAELQEVFTHWLYQEKIKLAESLPSAATLEAILCALDELQTNKNKKLVLQSLFLKL